ncbi:MAG: c-type cytochrome [Sphingobacteriales bacterium]|nr:MAG: c-type cytochrome [Sphingobacteriales bacterium]
MRNSQKTEKTLLDIIESIQTLAVWVTVTLLFIVVFLLSGAVTGDFWMLKSVPKLTASNKIDSQVSLPPIPPIKVKNKWVAPDFSTVPNTEKGRLIAYGRCLICNTSEYLGPQGSVSQMSNGMNCQNCHLEAGTKILGNNYSGVASTYPKFRPRSGTIENIEKRVNDCFERSLNGKALDSLNREMRAIVAYIEWVGKEVPVDSLPGGVGLYNVPYLDRPASPEKGQLVYIQKCQICHQPDGEGQLNPDGRTYLYPPLWGKNSYNIGAGLFRLSRFAGYVKVNMPLGATYSAPQLSDEEAWDVAAFVNSQPRPDRDLSQDWPKISAKPIDHPFGPFDDGFSEKQHKYGPYQQIADARKNKKELNSTKK